MRYAGGRDERGVVGPPGLRERGEEKVRSGRGRLGPGVLSKFGWELSSELDEVEMTEAFLLRSASVGL